MPVKSDSSTWKDNIRNDMSEIDSVYHSLLDGNLEHDTLSY